MNIAQVTAPVSIDNLSDADKLKSAISSGELRASAPLAGQNNFQWTERQKDRLASVLQSVRDAEETKQNS